MYQAYDNDSFIKGSQIRNLRSGAALITSQQGMFHETQLVRRIWYKDFVDEFFGIEKGSRTASNPVGAERKEWYQRNGRFFVIVIVNVRLAINQAG